VHDEAWLIRDKAGKPLFWQGYIIDITERKQIELELEQRAAELTALQETVLYLTARHSLPDLLNLIVERATKLLYASNGLLYLVNEEAETVTCVVSNNTTTDLTGTVLAFGEGVAGRVAKTGKPLIIKNSTTWPGKSKTTGINGATSQAVISAPMLWQGKVNGVLHLLRKIHFTQNDLDQLILFANHAALAVENTRLYDSAAQDLEERKRAEEALRESVAIYRQAIESTGGVPYYQSYSNGGRSVHYDFIGDGIQQLTGYESGEFTTDIWDSLVLEAHLLGDRWIILGGSHPQVTLRRRQIQ
jgi:PAS domain-containing protein